VEKLDWNTQQTETLEDMQEAKTDGRFSEKG
jgi:hypothetical protein